MCWVQVTSCVELYIIMHKKYTSNFLKIQFRLENLTPPEDEDINFFLIHFKMFSLVKDVTECGLLLLLNNSFNYFELLLAFFALSAL